MSIPSKIGSKQHDYHDLNQRGFGSSFFMPSVDTLTHLIIMLNCIGTPIRPLSGL